MTETRYQRIAREQAERQTARAARLAQADRAARAAKRRKPVQTDNPARIDPDGLWRDNLGHSPDY
jgi:hypothetical protein